MRVVRGGRAVGAWSLTGVTRVACGVVGMAAVCGVCVCVCVCVCGRAHRRAGAGWSVRGAWRAAGGVVCWWQRCG